MKPSAAVLLFLFAPLLLQAQTPLPTDSGRFIINQGNHAVGKSEFSIQPASPGEGASYAISSHGSLSVQNTKYSFSGSGILGQDLAIVQEDLNGIVNGSAVTFAVRSSGANFAIDVSANGKAYRNLLARTAQIVFFPDFDLSSYEILLTLAARQPGSAVSALIPKQTGILSAATLAAQPDVQAMLDGAALTVHHAALTIDSVTSDLYYSADNRILEVDIPGQAFAVVREKFQLQQPPPPPAEAAPGVAQPESGAPPQ